jgi:hypothetical protein
VRSFGTAVSELLVSMEERRGHPTVCLLTLGRSA